MMRTENVQNRRHNLERRMRYSHEDTGFEADTKRKHGTLMTTFGIHKAGIADANIFP